MEPVPTFPDTEDIEALKENDDVAIETNYEEEKIVKAKRKHLPGSFKARWSPQEMEIMDNIISINFNNAKSAYAEYLRQTDANSLPDRSFPSFKIKYMRIKQALKSI
jgi:hypothetical protein